MRLRWSRRALADMRRLAERIAADKPLAATRFVNSIVAKAAQLKAQPLLGRSGSQDDTRELVVHANYLLTYRLRGDEVQILQLWHVARDRPAATVLKT